MQKSDLVSTQLLKKELERAVKNAVHSVRACLNK